jgi:tetratricopeptide (TPR) repeat protein
LFRTLIMAALLSCGLKIFAADVSTEFDAANKLYGQGKFAEAASAYEKLIQTGAVSPAVYFNLGNAYFKAHELGHAIAAYHRAEQLAPRDPDVRANLQFAQKQVQGPTLSPARWQRLFHQLTLNEWTWLTAAAFWISLLLLTVLQIRPKLKPTLRGFVLPGFALTIVFGVCLTASGSYYFTEKAVVVAHEATIRNGPLEESPAMFSVHDGAELEVLDRKNDWLQVRVGDQRIGWIKNEQVILAPIIQSTAQSKKTV